MPFSNRGTEELLCDAKATALLQVVKSKRVHLLKVHLTWTNTSSYCEMTDLWAPVIVPSWMRLTTRIVHFKAKRSTQPMIWYLTLKWTAIKSCHHRSLDSETHNWDSINKEFTPSQKNILLPPRPRPPAAQIDVDTFCLKLQKLPKLRAGVGRCNLGNAQEKGCFFSGKASILGKTKPKLGNIELLEWTVFNWLLAY